MKFSFIFLFSVPTLPAEVGGFDIFVGGFIIIEKIDWDDPRKLMRIKKVLKAS